MQKSNLKTVDPDNFGLIGKSEGMNQVLRTIRKLRQNTEPVLVTGESGVGKELVARAIHASSPLVDKVFLPVDSASLVGSLMESELFGYVKGAFTGAAENKLGLVRAADGGTLFLDEIGELPTEVQAKLLRLLQEGEMRPIGATQPIRVNVRILAATNRDLQAEVRRGKFRKDLYYRLNVISVHIPALRERVEDIPLLAEHFIEKHAIHRVALSDEVVQTFQKYAWPGNIRELENTIRGLVALKSNPLVRAGDLPINLRDVADSLTGAEPESPDQIVPLAEVERRHILRAVRITKGDMNTASHLLGIGRTTLYRKLKAYGKDRREGDDIPRFEDSFENFA